MPAWSFGGLCAERISTYFSVDWDWFLQADQFNHLLRRVNVTSGLVTTLAGNANVIPGPPNNYGYADGAGAAAKFWAPSGVSMDAAGTFVLVVR